MYLLIALSGISGDAELFPSLFRNISNPEGGVTLPLSTKDLAEFKQLLAESNCKKPIDENFIFKLKIM